MTDSGFSIPLLVLAFTAVSCNPPTSIGAGFLPDPSFSVVEDSEIELLTSTVLLENVLSLDAARLVTGTGENEVSGAVSAHSFVRLTPVNPLSLEDGPEYAFDSLNLVLTYDGYFVGDTTQTATVEVFLLDEDYEASDEDDGVFYTSSSLEVTSSPLAVLEFEPSPRPGNTLSVKLDPELGRTFFRLLENESEDILTDGGFLDIFPGLRIGILGETPLLLGFSPTVSLDLHLANTSELPAEEIIRSFGSGVSGWFNRITGDLTGTALEGIQEDDPLPSRESGGLAVVQGGTALATRIELDDWLLQRERFANTSIRSAILEVEPIEINSDSGLPPFLRVYWVDGDNDIITEDEPAVLVEDLDFGREVFYRFDAGNFLDFQLLPDAAEDVALLLTFELRGSDASTLLLRGSSGPTLDISYLALDFDN